ncbi:DUF2283 domain-containing protein [Neorhizobium sp. NPDC001467]|uniref:DUF2283 domain-containing protein n=1 Tax=Neorhizobium sp. NPDC001467 TaxID=3390595 RepID=UPI003D000013
MSEFTVAYDAKVDVLYISKRIEQAARGTEDTTGIVWRYNGRGELISATVMDFRDLWNERRHQLADTISYHFGIPPAAAENVVEHAFDL